MNDDSKKNQKKRRAKGMVLPALLFAGAIAIPAAPDAEAVERLVADASRAQSSPTAFVDTQANWKGDDRAVLPQWGEVTWGEVVWAKSRPAY